jgi:hypothetical protein
VASAIKESLRLTSRNAEELSSCRRGGVCCKAVVIRPLLLQESRP